MLLGCGGDPIYAWAFLLPAPVAARLTDLLTPPPDFSQKLMHSGYRAILCFHFYSEESAQLP